MVLFILKEDAEQTSGSVFRNLLTIINVGSFFICHFVSAFIGPAWYKLKFKGTQKQESRTKRPPFLYGADLAPSQTLFLVKMYQLVHA